MSDLEEAVYANAITRSIIMGQRMAEDQNAIGDAPRGASFTTSGPSPTSRDQQ
jgi:hypothetical protein